MAKFDAPDGDTATVPPTGAGEKDTEHVDSGVTDPDLPPIDAEDAPDTEVLPVVDDKDEKTKGKKKSTKKADKKAKKALKAEKKEGKKKMAPATGAMIVLIFFFFVGLIAGHVFFGHPYAITLIAFGFMFMGAAGLVMAILKLFVIPAVEAVVEDIKKT